MTEANKYSPYKKEEDLRRAMCIHEAGHIVAYYYAFNTIDTFEWAVVDLEEYIKNKSTTSVETKF